LSTALAGDVLPPCDILPILQHFHFPIDDDSISSIMIGCCDNSGIVNVKQFLDFIDYRKSSDIENLEISEDAVDKLNTARDLKSTSNQMYDRRRF